MGNSGTTAKAAADEQKQKVLIVDQAEREAAED